MTQKRDQKILHQGECIDLSLFGTSDLHGTVVPFDYTKQTPSGGGCFARLAAHLENLRSKADNSMLFDNGDLIQGTQFSDTLANGLSSDTGMHSFLNLCAYDAATLGNHDLDFGAGVVTQLIEQASFPYVSANLQTVPFQKPPRSVVIDRTFTSRTGKQHTIRVGITSCLPQQTQKRVSMMGPDLALDDPQTSVTAEVEILKTQGADIVIVLAHSGYISDPSKQEPENFAHIISQIPDVTAVFAGHLHNTAFSPPDASGAPVAMAGCHASHIAQIDLCLQANNGTWIVTDTKACADPVPQHQSSHQGVMTITQDIHTQTNKRMQSRIGETSVPIQSLFSLLAPSSAVQIIHDAQLWSLEKLAQKHALTDLPQLSVAATGRTGGPEGPNSFTIIPAGDLHLHHFFDIYRFENDACAIVLTGREILNWMELAASGHQTIHTGQSDQKLFEDHTPGYNFDTFAGLDYEIDLTHPPHFDRYGQPITAHQSGGRIRNPKFNGAPLDPDQSFLVATTGFRANRFANAPMISAKTSNRALLVEYVTHQKTVTPKPVQNWRFTPISGATAQMKLPICPPQGYPLPENVEMLAAISDQNAVYRIRF